MKASYYLRGREVKTYKQPQQHEKEINLKEYVDVIKRRFWIIAIIIILTIVANYYISYYRSLNHIPLYETSTRMILGSDKEDMNTLMVMIKDPIIMESIKDELELSRAAEAIAGQIEITRIDDSQVIQISVVDQDAITAAAIANATAQSFKREIEKILDYEDVQLLSEAKENSVPINLSNDQQMLSLSIIIGFVFGIGTAFFIDSIDEKVRNERELEEIIDVPVLGTIGNMKKKIILFNGIELEGNERIHHVAIKEKLYS